MCHGCQLAVWVTDPRAIPLGMSYPACAGVGEAAIYQVTLVPRCFILNFPHSSTTLLLPSPPSVGLWGRCCSMPEAGSCTQGDMTVPGENRSNTPCPTGETLTIKCWVWISPFPWFGQGSFPLELSIVIDPCRVFEQLACPDDRPLVCE